MRTHGSARRGLGRGLRDVEAAVHVGVDGAQNHPVHLDRIAREQRAERLRQVEGGCLGDRIGGDQRQRGQRHHGQVVDDGAPRALEQRQKGTGHVEYPEKVDGKGALEDFGIAEVVVRRYAGVVDEEVEAVDRAGGALNVLGAGDVQLHGRNASVCMREWPARSRVHAPRSAAQRFVDECPADAAAGACDQNGLVCDVHVTLL